MLCFLGIDIYVLHQIQGVSCHFSSNTLSVYPSDVAGSSPPPLGWCPELFSFCLSLLCRPLYSQEWIMQLPLSQAPELSCCVDISPVLISNISKTVTSGQDSKPISSIPGVDLREASLGAFSWLCPTTHTSPHVVLPRGGGKGMQFRPGKSPGKARFLILCLLCYWASTSLSN